MEYIASSEPLKWVSNTHIHELCSSTVPLGETRNQLKSKFNIRKLLLILLKIMIESIDEMQVLYQRFWMWMLSGLAGDLRILSGTGGVK